MKIGVFGYGRAGKDTFSEMMGMSFTSSSEFANAKCVFPGWGEFHYKDEQACFDDRGKHREIWHDRISAYNAPDKAKLVEEVLKENDIYCGLRCKDELGAAYNKSLFDLTLWVDRSEHLPAEPVSSCSVTPEMCDVIIDNNGNLEHLQGQATQLLGLIADNAIPTFIRDTYFTRSFDGS